MARSRIILMATLVSLLAGIQMSSTSAASGAASSPVARQAPLAPIDARCCQAMAWDQNTAHLQTGNRVVQFGGVGPTGRAVGGTFYWSGSSWVDTTATGPCDRKSTRMAWDPATGDLVLFGGRAGANCAPISEGTLLNDTWLWDGTTWTACASCDNGVHTPPSARESEAMATEQTAGYLLMFGGNKQALAAPYGWEESTPIVADGVTWRFVGTVGMNDGYWEQKASTGPCARTSAAMAWDVTRGRVVLFGGECQAGTQDDTWTWKASTNKWEKCTTQCATHPSARSNHRLATYPTFGTGEAVLFGGRRTTSSTWCSAVANLCNDTWSNDGTWAQCTVPTCTQGSNLPQARCCEGLAYDGVSGLLIMYGGQVQNANGSRTVLDDTWTFNGATLTWTCVLGTCPP